ncbi:hypothetical protein RUM43_012833 [Polyplax serrata]|uniref:Uncharacterized protein n=1 Tax=Polyplax serrata TaxID=468196 RepID=A0AAN8RZD6_POLSC
MKVFYLGDRSPEQSADRAEFAPNSDKSFEIGAENRRDDDWNTTWQGTLRREAEEGVEAAVVVKKGNSCR